MKKSLSSMAEDYADIITRSDEFKEYIENLEIHPKKSLVSDEPYIIIEVNMDFMLMFAKLLNNSAWIDYLRTKCSHKRLVEVLNYFALCICVNMDKMGYNYMGTCHEAMSHDMYYGAHRCPRGKDKWFC